MKLELDTEAQALYLRLRSGRIAETIALGDTVFMDVDRNHDPLGIEFLDPAAFASFFEQRPDVASIPSHLTVQSVDRHKEWEVEVAAGTPAASAPDTRENARRLAQFVRDLMHAPATIDTIPDGALVILAPQYRPVVLHPLSSPAAASA
ncbi:MAG: DUF2283 domain-containing protein [Thermomicrobiales bacterium]